MQSGCEADHSPPSSAFPTAKTLWCGTQLNSAKTLFLPLKHERKIMTIIDKNEF
jgi:hypothetical protein